MRILFLSQLLPLPLDAGPKVRAYYVLRQLAAAGHDVTALCFVRPSDRRDDVDALGRYCRRVETVLLSRSRLRDAAEAVSSLLSPLPFLIRRDRQRRMVERLAQLVGDESFDAVHADQLWMAPYAEACRDIPFKVLDQHNAVFRVPQRLAAGHTNPVMRMLLAHEADKLAAYERRMIGRFDRVVWVSDQDREALGRRPMQGGKESDPIIPIAVDPTRQLPIARRDPFRVTFVGGLHWPPNAEGVRWFLQSCWPAVAEAVPRAVFTIIGRGGSGVIRRAAGQERVELVGYVSDLRRYLAETAVFVVPLLAGAGMRVKILEAWCWGLPVVSTTLGAEGLDATDGDQLVLADQPEHLAASVIAVLRDRQLGDRLAARGRALVERVYDWRSAYLAWNQVYPS